MDKKDAIRAVYYIKLKNMTDVYAERISAAERDNDVRKVRKLKEESEKNYRKIYSKIISFDLSVPTLDADGNQIKNPFTFLIEEELERQGFDTYSLGKVDLDVNPRALVEAISFNYAMKYRQLLTREESIRTRKPQNSITIPDKIIISKVLEKMTEAFPDDIFPYSKDIVHGYIDNNSKDLKGVVEAAVTDVEDFNNFTAALQADAANRRTKKSGATLSQEMTSSVYAEVEFNGYNFVLDETQTPQYFVPETNMPELPTVGQYETPDTDESGDDLIA